MKPLTFKQHERLREALAWISGPLCEGRGAEHRIEQLIQVFHGRRRHLSHTNVLSCAGIDASCRSSDSEGLLAAWINLAGQRLAEGDVQPARGDLRRAGVFAQPQSTSSVQPYQPGLPGRTASGDAKGIPEADKPHIRPGAALSPRESRVLQLTSAGQSSVAIAAALGISSRTVEHHRKRAIFKLEARNLIHAAVLFDRAERAAPQPAGSAHA